ncbi:hypothetical protein [uncultured Bacteroides sp.]|uniref:hypothetical protein n=1 Tax=uncultured Bacteroides sp. TaxID=162156 RepID=UPI002AA928C2|nr:hypothetical protein [uncultured Bacteroides sp.]
MNVMLNLKRPFIWLIRFRYRCGYGVHSPFAFDFITTVIYRKMPDTTYRHLLLKEKENSIGKDKTWICRPKKVSRLLFRLVSWKQPQTIVDAGRLSSSALFLQAAAKESAAYVPVANLSDLSLEKDATVDFLYLHHYQDPRFMEEIFGSCVVHVTTESVFVIEGIRYSKTMKALWKRMQADERTGITFDLYDLGIIFFDKKKIKQHYIINF